MAAFTRILKMDSKEAQKLCWNAYEAITNKNYHMYSYQ